MGHTNGYIKYAILPWLISSASVSCLQATATLLSKCQTTTAIPYSISPFKSGILKMSLRQLQQKTSECISKMCMILYIIILLCVFMHTCILSQSVGCWYTGLVKISTSVVLEDLLQDKGCHVHVGDDCNVRHLPQHKGKVAALGVL